MSALRSQLEAQVLAVSPEAVIFGSAVDRLPNTTLFAAPGVSAATAVIGFDLEGIAVSAGSACSSGKIAASHVLAAMGEPESRGRAGVRVSMTRDTTVADVEAFTLAWRAVPGRMRPTHCSGLWLRKRLMPAVQETVAQVRALDVDKYKYGFTTDIESDLAPKGLNEDIVRFISAKKNEPQWMTDWRLRPTGAGLVRGADLGARYYPKIDYQDLHII
jgi:hypothetical protein